MSKTCTKCGEEKTPDQFGRRRGGLHSQCRSCVNEYQKQYYDKNLSKHQPPGDRPAYMRKKNEDHKSLMNQFRAGPCADCGGAFSLCCMEFDHVVEGKRHNVAAMSSWSREAVLEELKKCEVVCACCHRTRTAKRDQYKQPQLVVDLPRWKQNKARHQREKMSTYRSWLNGKKNDACVDCSRRFASVAMDFDHVRGPKLFSLSNGWQYSLEEVLVEITKCDLVCANCHRVRTEGRRTYTAPSEPCRMAA